MSKFAVTTKADSSASSTSSKMKSKHQSSPASSSLSPSSGVQLNFASLKIQQSKLKVSDPRDSYEQEADRVAEIVMGMHTSDSKAENGQENTKYGTTTKIKSGKKKSDIIGRKISDGVSSSRAASEISAIHSGSSFPLDRSTKEFMESRFGYDFGSVRIHSDEKAAESAQAINAAAFTIGNDIYFANRQHRPDTETGRKLLAHELTHVIQNTASSANNYTVDAALPKVVLRQSDQKRIARQEGTFIEVEIISSRDEYRPPGSREVYRVGDAAASRVLLNIEERGQQVIFQVFNFETGVAEEMSPEMWSFYRGAAIIGGSNPAITQLGRQLIPAQWRSLWPNPFPRILEMFEAGQLNMADEAVLTGYRGMIRNEARRSLDENEEAVDEILNSSDRVRQLQEYATGLREASLVRDALETRREELSRRLVAQHSFTFGLPHAGTGPNTAQQIAIHREQAAVDDALAFWLAAFPLLTRLRTDQIAPASIEEQLRTIKSNIVSTRERLNENSLDPMTLDQIRSRLADRLGRRATAVVEAEDRSRSRWAIAGAVVLTAASIAILFLPGGIFVDAAIGVAIASQAISDAIVTGQAANTGLHVDEGLVSQSQAQAARFTAVLATVLALLGGAAAGFRILRFGRALSGLKSSMPGLALSERVAVARAIADDPALLSAFTLIDPGDLAVSARVAAAVRQAATDPRALRTLLTDVSRIAAIPRRVPAGADLYEPFRRIVDGSDIERIARETGLPRAQVEAAKRNLMLDEHILVDEAGALYRGRFDPFEEVANAWGRAARGEPLTDAQREFLRRLVRHEHAEGTILRSAGQPLALEQAFLRGELEGRLRVFLQSMGRDQAWIDRLLATEPRPITPYRYAHIVAHFSGAPNP